MIRTPLARAAKTPKKPPRIARLAAKLAGMPTPPQKRRQPPPRQIGADIKTPDHWRIVTAYLELSKGHDSLPRGALPQLKSRFPHLQLSERTIRRIFQTYKEQARNAEKSGNVRMTRRRASLTGGQNLKLTVELAQKMVEINDRNWGNISCKKVAGEMTVAGFPCSESSVKRWCKVLGATRRRRYIKPKLTVRHRDNRLTWVIDQYDKKRRRFGDQLNQVHGDEKWFYLMHDGTVCRMFPRHKRTESGEIQRVVHMPSNPKIFHKSRMPKVMFLAVTARPREEYQFDGKIGVWPFTITSFVKRSDSRTGTVAGEMQVFESVTVNADEYRSVLLKKDGVLAAIREKMWWYRRESGQPEAGQVIYYQHDGARPHTAAVNERQWARHGAKGGFKISVVVQPAQSPHLNVNDLAFFSSLQKDVQMVTKKNVFDLLEAVKMACDTYPADRMDAVWRVVYGSFKGILTSVGDNAYSHHTGSRVAHSQSDREGDNHDRSLP